MIEQLVSKGARDDSMSPMVLLEPSHVRRLHDREPSLKGTRLIPRLSLEDEGFEECALALLTGMKKNWENDTKVNPKSKHKEG